VERALSNNNEVTIGDLIYRGASALAGTSSSARLDSEVLLGHLLGYTRTQLIINSGEVCKPETVAHFSACIERRQRGEPTSYITGEREFWGLSFKVSPAVLVPRPESELIVEEALAFVGSGKTIRCVDLGVGSGCLSIAIVSELMKRKCDVRCVGIDVSAKALAVAESNAKRLGVGDRIQFVRGDWFEGVHDVKPPYDLIVANPPYIDPAEQVPVELSFEPQGALFAEEEGLKDVRIILEQSASMLRVGGLLLVEVGAGKRQLLQRLLPSFEDLYSSVCIGDDSPDDRFTVVRLIRR
jgi:release factor glutamine methyltransferase